VANRCGELLLELTSRRIVVLLDLSYLEEVFECADALELLGSQLTSLVSRVPILHTGFPGLRCVGRMDGIRGSKVRDLTASPRIDAGFKAFSSKVGSDDDFRYLRRRLHCGRGSIRESGHSHVDANQRWSLPVGHSHVPRPLHGVSGPSWIEELRTPTTSMVMAYSGREIAPARSRRGRAYSQSSSVSENFFQSGALHFAQAERNQLAGVSEFSLPSAFLREILTSGSAACWRHGNAQHLVFSTQRVVTRSPLFWSNIPHLLSHFVLPSLCKRTASNKTHRNRSSCYLKLLQQTC